MQKLIIYFMVFITSMAFAQADRHCPDQSQITQQGGFWVAPGGWKSANPIEQGYTLQSFRDARAILVKPNDLRLQSCNYITINKSNNYSVMVLIPPQSYSVNRAGGHWQGDGKGGFICISNQVRDCPFK